MSELGLNDLGKIDLCNDNRSAELLAKNSVYHARSKHIDLRYHFVHENVRNNEFVLKHLYTTNMLADFLTKFLPRDKFVKCMRELNMIF